jgi:alpha-tubulin suppressor-like RCC1 family protein
MSPHTISGLSAKSIQSGYDHICAIATDDTVKCWGDNQYGQLGNASNVDSSVVVTASGLPSATHLSTGAFHTCASTASSISCWGLNNAGQLGSSGTTDLNSPTAITSSRSGVTQLAAGLAHTCALSGTTLECWGSNASGQLSGSTSGGVSLIAVTLTNPKNVSAGLNHNCALDGGSQIYCWGAGGSGRLGPNASADSATPVLVP